MEEGKEKAQRLEQKAQQLEQAVMPDTQNLCVYPICVADPAWDLLDTY